MALGLLLCAFFWPACTAEAGPPISHRYDAQIQDASARWLPAWDWRWWKAQLYQESQLDAGATSGVGARGLCQAMPGTWRQIRDALHWGAVSPYVAGRCIEGGAYYMAHMRAFWTAQRPESDRRELAQASYNAGAGNILAAQRLCQRKNRPDCNLWPPMSALLPQVTGRANAGQTTTYVRRIRRWFMQLLAGVQ